MPDYQENQLVLKSPAKINLYLDVLRKRRDGYHDIETVFEKLAFFDIITISPEEKGIRITTDNLKLPTDKSNLAYKAAKAIFEKAKFKKGVWIDIKKNIPISAGLGGGSSNAATVLRGVNRLFKLGLKGDKLIEIGKTLGADVPFFLYDYNFAFGSARGDIISPIRSNIIIWHIIITFNFGVSTKMVYNSPNLKLTPRMVGVKMALRSILKNDVENLTTSIYNKLEEVVLNKVKIIGAVKDLLLKEGAYGALLSGSGPTIFGITKTREEAIAVRNRVMRQRSVDRILIVKTFSAVAGKE